MKGFLQAFEVRVHTFIAHTGLATGGEKLSKRDVGDKGHVMMLHFQARTADQAKSLAAKKGRVLSCRKVQLDEYTSGIERLELNQKPLGLYLGRGVYDGDLNIDEVLGFAKKPRYVDATGKPLDAKHKFAKDIVRVSKELRKAHEGA